MSLDHHFVASSNPRNADCARCGRPSGAHPVPESSYRDPHGYEPTFLREAAQRAEKRFQVATAGFEIGVTRRLEMGQRMYGNHFATLTPAERALNILEEGWDAGAYSVLDAQIRLAAGMDDTVAWHLFEIAQHAAAIDAHARQLRADVGE